MYEVHRRDAYTDLSADHSTFRSEKGTWRHVSLASIAWMLASTGDGGGKNRPTR